MLNFEKYSDKLVPAIVQDYKTNKVLMLAYMSKEAFDLTLTTKKGTYFSRSRQKIWVKGEESKNFQLVKEIRIDCDNDTVLLKVEQINQAACHLGYESCFFRKVYDDGKLKIVEERKFDPEKVYKRNI